MWPERKANQCMSVKVVAITPVYGSDIQNQGSTCDMYPVEGLRIDCRLILKGIYKFTLTRFPLCQVQTR